MRKKLPDTAAVIFAVNDDNVFFHCLVPKKVSAANSLRADEWVASFSGLLKAKCGGKDLYAQGSGIGAGHITNAVNLAKKFGEAKLN
jgi:alanyl-tRNA synthetase